MVDENSNAGVTDGNANGGDLESLTADVRKLAEAVKTVPFTEIMREYDTLQRDKGRIQTEFDRYREEMKPQLDILHDYKAIGELDHCRGLVAATTELERQVHEYDLSTKALRNDQIAAEKRVTQIETSTRAELALLEQYQAVKGKDSSPQNYAEVVTQLVELRHQYTDRGVEVEEALARGDTVQRQYDTLVQEKSQLETKVAQYQAKQQLADDTVSILRSELEAATARVNELMQWYKTRSTPSL